MSDRPPTLDDLRVKLCYICREEENAGHPGPVRPWVHPCNCTLVAHEACLLEWITSSEGTGRESSSRQCPQCKTQYQVESKNPVVLRVLRSIDRVLTRVDYGFYAAGFYLICRAIYRTNLLYGSWALRNYIGDETFDLLLGEDSSQWSLVAKLHMVMIPTGLIMTRLGLGHITAVTLGSWPTFAFIPAVMHQSKSLDLTHSSLTGEGAKLPWPPSPFVFGFILLPLCQRFYRHYFNKFSNWVLNANPAAGPARRRQPGLRGLLQGILDDMERAAEARAAQQPNEDNDRADIQVEVEGEPAVLSVDIRKACRLVGGALLSPLIASAMGKLLLRISSYFPLLRRFLAIRPASTGFLPAPFLRRYSPTEIWRRVTDPTIKDGKLDLTQTLKFVSRAVWGDMRKLDECDPVWWRNSIGFGIFIMTKDLLQLLHVWLSKREVASRRVKSWDFSAVDPRELDLIRPSVRADLTMPGAL